MARLLCIMSLATTVSGLTITAGNPTPMKPLAGYVPRTFVSDVAAVDKDQLLIHQLLAEIAGGNSTYGTVEDDFAAANAVYLDGGNSRATAEVELQSGLEDDIVEGTLVEGLAVDGKTEIQGLVHKTYKQGEQIIRVEYQVKSNELVEEPIGCNMGGLQEAEKDNKTGCFVEKGTLTIGGKPYDYRYDVDDDNIYLRTLSSLSKHAREEMLQCDYCPIPEFAVYNSFFGYAEYAHRWIESALTGKDEFSLKKKNLEDRFVPEARADAASRGTIFLSVYMYVIKELTYAVGKCQDEEPDASFHWDSAVALYVGSLHGQDTMGNGVMLYSHAEMRCHEFRTCGPDGSSTTGTAKANLDIMSLFESGRDSIASGSCDDAQDTLDQIIPTLRIPLIQGILRSAYRLDPSQGSSAIPARHAGDAATFTMSLMPVLDKCDAVATLKIFHNTKVGAESTRFDVVKEAIESTYDCLGVTCEDIGGLYAKGKGGYRKNAEPCTFEPSESSSSSSADSESNLDLSSSSSSKKGGKSAGRKAGISLSILFLLGLIAFGGIYYYKPNFINKLQGSSGMNNNNDAADFTPSEDVEIS